MATVRAKFYVRSIEAFYSPKDTGTVKMAPVYESKPGVSGNACEENKFFWQATPSGELTMAINNPEAFKRFEVGKSYYIDFTPAD